jgi:hypothetical protein
MQLQVINALADWHGSTAVDLYVAAQRTNNNFKSTRFMELFTRHIKIHDRLRNAAWVIEHTSKHKRGYKNGPRKS